ncbi:hypothetical protein T05_3451 [Trichinella murrelli]|uniref:Uncharacterized protein n=1 Tax=Trichinella murrelli TaxID=144512 RepID=A0A0V0T601_9BILA|nr:hypothetical protein T05_3451 [Trichinella murrelli]
MCTKRAENVSRLPLTPQQLEIPAHRQLSKSGQENLSTLNEHSVLSMDETLKIVPEWYQRLFTIHVFYGDCPYPCSSGIVSGGPRPRLLLSFLPSSSEEAFLPLAEVPDAVDLLGRDVAEQNVDTPTNNHLEGWHFKMNRQAGKYHLGFYELLRLLIDEQGSTETLIQ